MVGVCNEKEKISKEIRKSITHSWGRFISIMFLMALGSFALVGLFVTGPNMRATGTNYFNKYNTADITIISNYGIDKSEQEYIEKASDIKDIEYIFLKDVIVENTNISFRVFSRLNTISLYEVKEGNLPEDNNEIAIDYSYHNEYKIGDTITFTEKLESDSSEETLKIHEFKIVGFIYSSDIVSSLNKGQTTVGTGELDSYAVINAENLNSDVYMMTKITFNDLDNIDPYSDIYTNLVQKHKEELTNLLGEQQNIRFESIKGKYQIKIDDSWQEVNNAKQKLKDVKTQLEDAKTKLDKAKTEIETSENKLINAQTQITKSESEVTYQANLLNQKQKEYDMIVQTLEIKKAEYHSEMIEINNKQDEINKVKAELESARKQYLQYGEKSTQYQYFLVNAYNPKNEELNIAQTQIDNKIIELNSAKNQIRTAENELKTTKTQLDNGATKIANAKTQLKTAKNEYNSGLKSLTTAKNEYIKKEQEYTDKKLEFETEEPDATQKIKDSEKELNDAQKEVNQLGLPTYSVNTRREMPGSEGYIIYTTVAEMIDDLAKIFPIFLYFVAALVTLTTMTRFVNEERVNTGTLKALGYSDYDITKKFIIYGFLAGIVGTLIGIIFGHILLPNIVYNAYSNGFTLPKIELHFYPIVTIASILLSLFSSVIPSFIVSKKELQEKPASLLLPKAPKAGTKILLEKITPIWNKMSFTHKVTARNILDISQECL